MIPQAPDLAHNISRTTVFLVIVAVLLRPSECYAYADPNVAGWLFQSLLPVLLALGAAWAVLRQRIRALWRRLLGRSDKRT
jgi:hypothetical protein